MKITSYGATEEVTGSKHLLEVNGFRILLDCGLFQGRRNEADRKNRSFGFDPASIHAVVLSHAHIDHSGLLPMLYKQGYRGNVYTTHATRDLCSIMLLDSAHIQERDAQWLSKKKMEFIPPLYSSDDVRETMRHFVSLPYETAMPLHENVTLTLHDAGHVLGSAMMELDIKENGTKKKLVFSGDIGRCNMPILRDPWAPSEADVVMMETTYGNREHHPIENVDKKLAQVIRETYERGGKIIVPSFALERAQEIIYALKRLESWEDVPKLPVFVDSPLTVDITEIFRLHTEGFDDDFGRVMRNAGNPFDLERIRYIRNVNESMELNRLKEPAIIVSASGMCEYGRVVHHLCNSIADPRNTVLIVGFQAQHTLGRRIVERNRTVRIHGVPYELNARVVIMNEFSAHAGHNELVDFAARFNGNIDQLLLVHGEPNAQKQLETDLRENGVTRITRQKYAAPFTC